MSDRTNPMAPPEKDHLLANTQGGLEPPRFSLRRLFFSIAAVAVCIVMFQQLSPQLMGVGLLGVAMIGLHVIGNAMGTRLRSSAELLDVDPPKSPSATNGEATHGIAPATKLSHHSSLGWPMVVATVFGIVAGGVGGFKVMEFFYGDRLKIEAVMIGVVAASALSGFWCFWCWSLMQVMLSAWWHAHSAATLDQQRTRRHRKEGQ